MIDRNYLIQNISKRIEEGEHKLLETGPILDDVLINEIKKSGTDRRYGVNLICRPSEIIMEHIQTIIEYLSNFEPNQYFYPIKDIHLTLLEICHSQPIEKVDRIADILKLNIRSFLSEVERIKLDSPILSFDPRGVALNFIPSNDSLQTGREIMSERINNTGIQLDARYAAMSAHVTLMRYISPISIPIEKWIHILKNAPQLREQNWIMDNIFISWGATWYGMASCIKINGPYKLKSEGSEE